MRYLLLRCLFSVVAYKKGCLIKRQNKRNVERQVCSMKVGVYNTVKGGVPRFIPFVEKYKGQEGEIELVDFGCPPSRENLHLLKDHACEGVIYSSDHKEDEAYFKEMADCGVKYVCCSCTGYDHFNLPAMRKYGLKGANVPAYSPNAISEHTVMLMLSCLRHLRNQVLRVENHQYKLQPALMGREIRNMTIGVIGAGRIGCVTLQCLSGFGPKKMLACDPYPNDAVRQYAEYVSLDELLAQSDVVILHMVLNDENYHLINKETIQKMKDKAVLINTSRGGLVDADALYEALKDGKLAAAAVDVIEGEGSLNTPEAEKECPIPVLKKLLELPDFIFTPHAAFYTDEANRNIAQTTIENLHAYALHDSCEKEIIAVEK